MDTCTQYGHVFNRSDYWFFGLRWSRLVCFWCGVSKRI